MPTWLLAHPCLATYENHIFSESVFNPSRIVEKILAYSRHRILKDAHQENTIKHLPSKGTYRRVFTLEDDNPEFNYHRITQYYSQQSFPTAEEVAILQIKYQLQGIFSRKSVWIT